MAGSAYDRARRPVGARGPPAAAVGQTATAGGAARLCMRQSRALARSCPWALAAHTMTARAGADVNGWRTRLKP